MAQAVQDQGREHYAAQVLTACLLAFEEMSYIPSSSFTGLALQQLLSMSAKKPGALLAKLALIQRVGQQPLPEALEALQQKVSRVRLCRLVL